MRLIYYGTPPLAVPPLRRLVETGRAPLLVVTRPDRPRGRGLRAGRSAVGEAAESLGIPVATPARAGAPEEMERVRSLEPDLLVVVAYGQILPGPLLEAPRLGALNVHFSLLPRHRGAAPIQAAILAGDSETGVTTMWMTQGLDEGPVFLARSTPIGSDEDAGALGARLAELGAACLIETLERIERGERTRAPQDAAGATYAPKLARDAGRLELARPASEVARRVRAFTPDPGAFLDGASGRLLVRAASEEPGDARPPEGSAGAAPGTVLALDRERGIRVATGSGSIWLRRLQPAGRREMGGFEYALGARLRVGGSLTAPSEAS